MHLRNILAFGLLALLVACGGGGGSPGTCMASAVTCAKVNGSSPPPPIAPTVPVGLFRGTTGDARTVAVLVLESGDIWLIDSAPGSATALAGVEQAHGVFSSGSFTGSNLRDFNVERPGIESGTIAGTFVDKSSITGTATLSTLAMSFLATFDVSSGIPATLATIAGSYSGSIGSASGTDNAAFTIGADGTLTGLGQLGCRFSGAVSPEPGLNAYAVSVTLQGGTCPGVATSLAGVAVFDSGTRRLSGAALNADRSSGFIFTGTK